MAVAALDAGKHVVIEKPIDVSLAAADRIIDAEARSGKKATVISQHRFDRSTETVLQAVTDGTLGTITSAIASHAWWRGQSYYDSGEWRGTWALDGGGAVMNQTVHTINLMLTMVGTPVEVFAYTACLAHERIEVEDTAVAVVRFASGALGLIHGTTAAYPGLDARLSVYGTTGSAVVSDDQLVYLHETVGEATEIGMSSMTGENQVTAAHQIGSDELQIRPCAPAAAGRLHRRDHHRRHPAGHHLRRPHLARRHPGPLRVRCHRPAGAAVTVDRPLRVGLIGCGSIASQHLDAVSRQPGRRPRRGGRHRSGRGGRRHRPTAACPATRT